MARITRSGAWGGVCKVVQEAACPLLLPLPSPPSPALSSFPSLEKKGLLAFYLVSISVKRFLIPYCALQPPRWATLPGGSLGGAASSAPWGTSPTARLPSPHKHPQLSSERNDISKSTGARDVFSQRRHPQLCLSSAVLHHNAAPCLAQKRKSGSSQTAVLWQRKTGGISDATNFI